MQSQKTRKSRNNSNSLNMYDISSFIMGMTLYWVFSKSSQKGFSKFPSFDSYNFDI